MLPFSSFEFFIIMAIFIVIVGACRLFLKDNNYKYTIAVLNAAFLFLVYPKPLHFFLLIVFSFVCTWLLSDIFKLKKKIWGILLLLLPMLLVKFDIRFDFYPFELNNLISFAGLSYASFRIVGYFMDKAPGEKMAGPVSYFNFLAFTPTLLIGPIDKYSRYKASEEKGFSFITSENFISGWEVFVKGLAYKYVFAELVDRCWLSVSDVSSKELLPMLNNMYAYYPYLFFDFAGYSFMALGIGKMMGINVPLNFNNPFIAVNPQDFWKRWHISLGDWLKDYFFTPLYMFFSRKKSLKKYPMTRQNLALFLTFLLMGCWNGFKLNFILSGALLGVYSAVHNTYMIECKKRGKDIIFGNMSPNLVKYISIFIMFNLTAVALYIFSGRCPLL